MKLYTVVHSIAISYMSVITAAVLTPALFVFKSVNNNRDPKNYLSTPVSISHLAVELSNHPDVNFSNCYPVSNIMSTPVKRALTASKNILFIITISIQIHGIY